MLDNQRGSVTAMGIILIVIFTIMLAGLVPMLTTELKFTKNNRDILEAQYAAESGAKRAISGIVQKKDQWAWTKDGQFHSLYQGSAEQYKVSIDPIITTIPVEDQEYKIISVGSVGSGGAQKTVIVYAKIPKSGTTKIPLSSAFIGALAQPSGSIVIQTNTVKVLNHSSSSPSLGNAIIENNQATPPSYDYAKYAPSAIDYTLHKQSLGSQLYRYNGNLNLVQNDNLSGTSDNNAVLFVNGDITISGGGININNVILVATGNITLTGSASFSNSVLISNSNITFNSYALLQPCFLVTPGTVSFNKGVTWGNHSTAYDQKMINLINNKLEPFAAGSSSSGSDAGNASIYGWSN